MSNYQFPPQTAPPKYSASKPAIFDGTDSSISFLDFIQVLQVSPDWTGVNPSMAHNNMEDILPAHLYGPALRYYESLHPVFSGDWERLRDVMTFRFPGPLRSGGMVRRSATRWDEDGLWTAADTPPSWTTPLMSSATKLIQTETSVRTSPKRNHFASALKITEKLRLPSINRSPSPSHTSFHGPQVTVHALYIESDYGGTIWSPPHPTALEAKVDLNDQQAVLATKKDPLITILASHAKGYRIGFLYSVNYGENEINFWHNILAPKEFSMFYSRKIGIRSVSPMGFLSDAHSITEFIYDRRAYIPNHERASPGQYTVKSHIHVGIKDVGEITWRINIV